MSPSPVMARSARIGFAASAWHDARKRPAGRRYLSLDEWKGYLGVAKNHQGPRVSQLLIQHYLNDLQTLRRVSGTSRKSVVREAFKTLLKDWGKSRDLIFVPEYEYQTLQKTRVVPDGTLLHALRVPLGYWEAKDEEDDLDAEIAKKFRKGYPQDNIIFGIRTRPC